MRKLPIAMAISVATLATLPAVAQTAPPPPTNQGDTVSRSEYDALKRDHDELRREVEELRRERQAATTPSTGAAARGQVTTGVTPAPAPGASPYATQEDLEEIDKTIHDIQSQLHEFHFGTDKLVIAGDAAFGFQSQKGTKSTFTAGIAPLALWQPTDRLLIEAAADIGLDTDAAGSSSTSFDLTIANASYIVNDYLVVGGGLFVAPFGVYHRHFDPPWINKLPDDPLVFSDGGLAPSSIVGAFLSGGAPVGHGMKVLYDAYVSNGPNVETQDPDTAGQLLFDNFLDLNNNKAVGGRIALQPITELEVGYSIQYGKSGATDFQDLDVVLQAVDAAYRKEFDAIAGTLDVHGEWVWSNVGKATYDPTGSLGFGPTRFSNVRNGGYVLVAYRPTLVHNKLVRNTEYVFRYDSMFSSLKAPGGDHEQRFTLGVDYWITPAAVFKVAYEFDHRKAESNADAFFVQLGLGL